jgi:PKD repeat protein
VLRTSRAGNFDGSDSTSNAQIVGYQWWWDDETTTDLTAPPARHVYGFAATFNVTLTVTGANGKTAAVTHAVTVR